MCIFWSKPLHLAKVDLTQYFSRAFPCPATPVFPRVSARAFIIIIIMREYYLGAVKSKRTARAPYKIKINMSCGVG